MLWYILKFLGENNWPLSPTHLSVDDDASSDSLIPNGDISDQMCIVKDKNFINKALEEMAKV